MMKNDASPVMRSPMPGINPISASMPKRRLVPGMQKTSSSRRVSASRDSSSIRDPVASRLGGMISGSGISSFDASPAVGILLLLNLQGMKKEFEPQPINVDGETYFWKLRHGWVTEQDIGAKGISVSVSLKPERTRELILDFAVTAFGRE